MSLGDLTPRSVATRRGPLVLWSRPSLYESRKPVLLAIGGMFASGADLAKLPDVLGLLGEACVMRMPAGGAPLLDAPGVTPVAEAVSEAVETLFKDRPVVLMGVSIGATVALAVRAPNLARVVA